MTLPRWWAPIIGILLGLGGLYVAGIVIWPEEERPYDTRAGSLAIHIAESPTLRVDSQGELLVLAVDARGHQAEGALLCQSDEDLRSMTEERAVLLRCRLRPRPR